MKGKLVGLILPASIAGIALGAVGAAGHSHLIPEYVFRWLWPSLLAVLFLTLAIGALVMRWTRWVWPPLAAFLVQLVGILLMVGNVFKFGSDFLWYTLGTFLFAILLVLGIWLVVAVRTRALEKKLLEGQGGGDVDAQALAKIRKDMGEALAMLRRAGKGRNAIYELPWLLVMGRPQGGKTFAIKKSGLSLPVRQDWVKGVGGTFTADWFFTNEIIFLDTPGKWVQDGVGEDGAKHWTELLRLLRKNRGRRPLDGLIVVVPADDLLSKTRDELFDQAAHVREVIDLIHDELKFRFPVYLLVSKTDLVEGFVDFFKGLPANRKHQVFGWSHPDPNDREAVSSLRKAFRKVLRRMSAYRLEILARTASASAVRRLFFFTEEFRRLEDPLVDFAEALFQPDPYHETPVFRGFYFTSATQGDGAPLGQAMSQLARTLGIRTVPTAASDDEGKRSYFLLDLFRGVMVGDEGLVSRTAGHWLRRRRDTVFAAFLPAAIASAVLLFSLLSFALTDSLYKSAGEEIPGIVKSLEKDEQISSDALDALENIDKIRDFHRRMTGFSLLRPLGMRRPGEVAEQTFDIFSRELEKRVLRPTFARAKEIAASPSKGLADRADAFYSVVWIAQGHVIEYADDLKGFEQIWSDLGTEKAAKARALLVTQVEYLLSHGPRNKELLHEFDLPTVADAIAKGAAETGSASAMRAYLDFTDMCAEPASSTEIRTCDKKLSSVLTFKEGDLVRLGKNLDRLKDDLANIEDREPGAKAAGAALRGIHVASSEDDCSQQFDRDILPTLKAYYLDDQKKQIDACRQAVDSQGPAKAHDILLAQDQDKERQNLAKALSDQFQKLNAAEACKLTIQKHGDALDPQTVFRLSEQYRRVECVREPDAAPREALAKRTKNPGVAARASSGGTAGPAAPASAPPGGASLGYLSRGAVPSLDLQAWYTKKGKIANDMAYVATLPPGAERSKKEGDIRQTVDAFAQQYQSAWKSYLSQIRIRGDGAGDPGKWLLGLSDSKEWRTALSPPADALSAVGATASDPVLNSFDHRLAGLANNLSTFLNGDLGQYQALLAEVGNDVTHCQGDQGFAAKYRAGFQSGDAGNSIVKAERWVREHGGESLSEGSLKDLLQRPLEIAKNSLGTSSDPNRRWNDLIAASTRVKDKFPFGGHDAQDLVSLDDLRALLGGASGQVPALWAVQKELHLGAEAAKWLERAHALSEIFFDPGKDDPKPYTLQIILDLSGTDVQPAKAAADKDWRLEGVLFDFGGDSFDWAADTAKPNTKKVQFELFGDQASGISKLVLVAGEKVGRKEKWVAQKPTPISSWDGFWAPLQTIAAIKDAARVGDRITLTPAAKFPYKKNEDGAVKVRLVVQGRGLPMLLDLLANPLPPAPGSGS
jgi:type VI protein secretion system component VasK